ncbi:MAG TPA: rod shape-determining protein RodA [Bacteroidia bacterium]|nr:rod shape-determining protein RodA [Bacteroidia bacterium]
MKRTDTYNPFANIDKLCVLFYFLLVLMGWLNIYAAVYNEEHKNIFDMSQKYGKQLIWISSATVLAIIILFIDADFYTVFAYLFYGIVLVLCIAVPFLGREVKGSRSWFRFGDFGIQPAEFMKFATNLALAKFLSNANLEVDNVRRGISNFFKKYRNTIIALVIIGLPLIIIKKLQDETGLAIVFAAFVFTLYREGLSVNFLLFGFIAAVLFVLALLVDNTYLFIIIGSLCALSLLFIQRSKRNIFLVILIGLVACGMVKATSSVYEKLEAHQKIRIDVLLGRGTINLKKEGYNVNQAKIAIGSGGFLGKGYLQGTQTKYDFVPEQDTDFIFCTVGEEWGFVGTSIVILLQLTLILKIITMAERQRSEFSRIYGYGVASVLFFHLAINIGMTIGLAPVIGIPLPFFSYGGSSLWSFTILLFIFIKLDANRLSILR